MSRKKKKKQKKLLERVQEQDSLNGWDCPAIEIDDSDDDDSDEDIEIDGQEQPEVRPHSWKQSSREIPKPVWAPEPEFVQMDLLVSEPKPRLEPKPEPRLEPKAEPEPVSKPELEPEPEPVPPTADMPEPTAEKTESGNLADDIKERMTGRLLKSKDGLLKLFTEPRRSNAEIEEDKTKFGGLDDEEVEQDDEQDETEPPELLKKLRNLRGTPQDPPASEHPSRSPVQPAKAEKSHAAGITHKIEKTNPVYPIMRYAYETYSWGYTECYYIGIQVLRNCADLRRRLFTMGVWARYNIPHFIRVKRHQIARVLDGITDSCLHPFRDIVTKSRSMRIAISRILRQQEEGKAKASGRVFLKYLYSLGKPINSIASFILPILGCAVLAAVILYFQQISYALEVEYSGVKLGYIAREGDFYEAKNKVYARLINEEYAPADDSRPSFRLVITDEENLLSTEALANKIMTVSKNEVAMADGIYIDGAFLGAVEDGSEFLFYIDSILDNYRTNTAHERVQFVKKVALQRGMYPISSIRPVHEIKNALENNESLPQSHKVEKGETLETIAEKNNTTVKAIIGLNPTLAARSEEDGGDVPVVFAGEEILVNKVELSLGIQVTRRETYTEEIDFGVDYKDDNKQLDSYVVTLSNGIKGEREIISDVTYIDGERVNETVIERNVVKEPVNAKKVRGTLKPAEFLPAGSGDTNASFIWPVAGGYVSAGLYGYRGHTGMDIAAPYGTGIYAARSGTVTYASNKNIWPYGRRVNINHGDGVTSLYAHCSEVLVQPGQYVKQGQLIAKIGRTGNASGNHLHIEIKINGRIMNPADFIGKG